MRTVGITTSVRKLDRPVTNHTGVVTSLQFFKGLIVLINAVCALVTVCAGALVNEPPAGGVGDDSKPEPPCTLFITTATQPNINVIIVIA